MHPARREQARSRYGIELARFLRESREDILRHWARVARDIPPLRELPRELRLDHIPLLLDRLAALAEHLDDGHDARAAAARHARDRLGHGVELGVLVHELAVLRDSMIELWDRIQPIDLGPLQLLNRVMNEAIAAAVEEYSQARDHALRALDAVSAAALEARTIDHLFVRLLDAFRTSTPVADTAAILLRDDGRLVMRASFGLEPGTRHFRVERDGAREGFAELVARVREPVYIPDASAHGVVAETPQASHVRALFGVPLIDAGRLIGVAHLGSQTARELPLLDRQLFTSMAIRATAGIAQHVARDLAQRRATQLAASEKRFRATFDGAPVGIAHVALDGTWLRVNPRLCEMAGYSEQELRSARWQDLFRRGGLYVSEEAQAALLDGRISIYTDEAHFTRRDGRVVWLRLTASVIQEAPSQLPYYIAIVEDITDRRAIEDALRAGEEHARRMLARERAAGAAAERALAALDALLGAAPAGVLIVDRDLRYVRVNETIARMDGVPVDAHLGRPVAEVLGDAAPAFEPWLRRVLDTGEIVGHEFGPPSSHAPSRPLSLLGTFYPVRTPTGEILGVGGIILDITERKAMEDALRASEQRAHQSVRLREQVLATVSHDLKNPLGAIRAAASLVLESPTLDPEVRKYLELIDRSSGRMDRMIKDLLDLATIESGSLSLDLQLHDAREIVNAAWELHEVVAGTKSIVLTCTTLLPKTEIRCDRERVLQVLGNLIGNALKFCRPDDRIEIEAHRERGEVVFSVSDTGPGIPADQIDHLFEAYWTTARSADQGSGLGLYISKGIVEAHGGHIDARNREPHGAVFWFTLPVRPG